MIARGRCECCGADRLEDRGKFGGQFAHLACGDCGFESYRSPDAVGNPGSSVYETDSDYQDDVILGSNHRRLLQWHHKAALDLLFTLRGSNCHRVLDVGCHTGFFVRELLNRGVDAHGVDWNSAALKHGKTAYDLEGRISSSQLSDLGARGERYSVVTSFEVLEHVAAPAELLAQMVDVVQPGGALAISVPNARMIWRPPLDYPPHHMSRFTPRAIRRLLERHSLQVVAHIEQMSVYELLRHRVGVLLRDQSKSSLRGGAFRYRRASLAGRRFLNAIRPGAYLAVAPLDKALHWLGMRYIGQLIVARR